MPRSNDRGTFAWRATIAGLFSARGGCGGGKLQRHAIHAIAKASGLGTIVEDMAEMAAAASAMHLGAHHAEGPVLGFADGVVQRLVETRPAGATLELGLGRKQR